MTDYRIRATGAIVANLAQAFPHTSWPSAPSAADLDGAGLDAVWEGARPALGPHQRLAGAISLIDGVWTRGYTAVDMTAEEIASLPPTAPPPPMPASVTNFQGRAVLRQAGLFDAADAAVAAKAAALDAADDPIAAATLREAWDKAQFMRASPLLAELGALLGVSAEQMDGLFIAAASIEL